MGNKVDQIIGGIVLVLGTVAAAAAGALDPVPKWLAVSSAILAAVGGLFRVGVFSGTGGDGPKPPPIAPVLAVVGLLSLAGATGCQPFEAAWRVTGGVRSAANLTDKAIADAALKDHDRCIKAHGAGTSGYRDCIKPSKGFEALRGWRAYGVPGVNSALVATVTALQIAERADQKKLNWMEILRPAACALSKILKQWGELLGPNKAPIMAAVAAVEGGTCD